MKSIAEGNFKAEPFQAFLSDISALGVNIVSDGGLRYAVIGARSNLRWWLISLEDPRAAAAGFEMLQPVNKSARAAKNVGVWSARLGLFSFIAQHQLRLSGLPNLSGAFDGRATQAAYFTGTDGPHRKTAMQFMDSNGTILGYGKFSRASHVRRYLRNEAEILRKVTGLGLETATVPAVVKMLDDEAYTLLVTDSIKSTHHSTSVVLADIQIGFLRELRAKTERRGARGTLEMLCSRAKALAPVAGIDWTDRFLRVYDTLSPMVETVPVCLAHGDFTPWNTFLQGGQLYVFDWEYADATLPVGFDLAHFYLATTSPDQQVRRVPALRKAVADAHFDGNRRAAGNALLLSLACHAVFYLNRLAEANSPLALWNDGPVRSEMIERLLTEQDAEL